MTFHHYELLVLFQMIPASILEAMSILIFKKKYIYSVYINRSQFEGDNT